MKVEYKENHIISVAFSKFVQKYSHALKKLANRKLSRESLAKWLIKNTKRIRR